MKDAQQEITEQTLRDMFDQNFARLRLESGHSLGLDVRDAAWECQRSRVIDPLSLI